MSGAFDDQDGGSDLDLVAGAQDRFVDGAAVDVERAGRRQLADAAGAAAVDLEQGVLARDFRLVDFNGGEVRVAAELDRAGDGVDASAPVAAPVAAPRLQGARWRLRGLAGPVRSSI